MIVKMIKELRRMDAQSEKLEVFNKDKIQRTTRDEENNNRNEKYTKRNK